MEVGFFETIARDLSGKGQFRLVLQPLAAVMLGVGVGVGDATNRIWRRTRTRRFRARPRTA